MPMIFLHLPIVFYLGLPCPINGHVFLRRGAREQHCGEPAEDMKEYQANALALALSSLAQAGTISYGIVAQSFRSPDNSAISREKPARLPQALERNPRMRRARNRSAGVRNRAERFGVTRPSGRSFRCRAAERAGWGSSPGGRACAVSMRER